MVGQVTLDLKTLCVKGKVVDEKFTVEYEGESSGEIRLKARWKSADDRSCCDCVIF